jgi:hypothetical protein
MAKFSQFIPFLLKFDSELAGTISVTGPDLMIRLCSVHPPNFSPSAAEYEILYHLAALETVPG